MPFVYTHSLAANMSGTSSIMRFDTTSGDFKRLAKDSRRWATLTASPITVHSSWKPLSSTPPRTVPAALLDFLTAPFFERLGQSQRAGQCPPRVVRLWLRLPKHSHHPIADELVNGSAIGEHSAGDDVSILTEDAGELA